MARARGGGGALVLAAAVACVLWAAAAEARSPAARAHRHLKRLNKPPVKSIESPDGDIIDCVHISHQPAFDHPLLKNHTIQFRLAYHPEGLYDDAKSSIGSDNASEKPKLQLWHQNGRCPADTVPIRRTKKVDLLRASSMRRYGRKRHTAPNPMSVDPNMLSEGGHQVREHGLSY
uniref:Neprosin activation peptide domain-containing protein n=1 Tax=Arundo donax TaxID=35708 RepID=A0A0A9CIY6_ARUDO